MKRPLEGIRVLDLTQAYSGPFCTMNLADHGAEVIKIEVPNLGDQTRTWGPIYNGCSGYYSYVNRNKKGMTLNLKSEEGKKIFVAGHPEYDRYTLNNEYHRDLDKGLPIQIPYNYYPNDDPE